MSSAFSNPLPDQLHKMIGIWRLTKAIITSQDGKKVTYRLSICVDYDTLHSHLLLNGILKANSPLLFNRLDNIYPVYPALLGVYWVNLSKRGGKDGIFWGLAGLLWGISRRRSPREIPRSSPASPRKTPSFPTLLLRFTFYFQHVFSKYWGQQASKFF